MKFAELQSDVDGVVADLQGNANPYRDDDDVKEAVTQLQNASFRLAKAADKYDGNPDSSAGAGYASGQYDAAENEKPLDD